MEKEGGVVWLLGGEGHALASCEVSVALLFGSMGKAGIFGDYVRNYVLPFPAFALELVGVAAHVCGHASPVMGWSVS